MNDAECKLTIFDRKNVNNHIWNAFVSTFETCSILQSWEWGEIKSRYGWDREFLIWELPNHHIAAAAMVLLRNQKISPIGFKECIIYIPHGPLLEWSNQSLRTRILEELKEYSKKKKAIFIKIDPRIVKSNNDNDSLSDNSGINITSLLSDLTKTGWQQSEQQIQFKNTFWIDLSRSEEELLASMKQKTRYNIKLAEKKGVLIRELGVDEISILYILYEATSFRDGFVIRPKEYYLELWRKFMEVGFATALIAEVDQKPVAGLLLFHFAGKSYYMYGMSLDQHREKMPNYLLQWEAIKRSKSSGCRIYDLWGAPDILDKSDRMWGVFRFKEGLGGKVVQTIGAFDYPTSKFKYKIFQEALPRIQGVTRKLRRIQIDQDIKRQNL